VDVWIHVFFASVLVEGEWSASRLGRFTPLGNRPRYPSERRLAGFHGLSGRRGDVEWTTILPLPGLELQPLGLPALRHPLYRLSSFKGTTPLYDLAVSDTELLFSHCIWHGSVSRR
jgi:hypothetical protein